MSTGAITGITFIISIILTIVVWTIICTAFGNRTKLAHMAMMGVKVKFKKEKYDETDERETYVYITTDKKEFKFLQDAYKHQKQLFAGKDK